MNEGTCPTEPGWDSTLYDESFGIITKEEWVPLFAVVGLARESAFALMPLSGFVDVAAGILVLFRPVRAAVSSGRFQ